MARKTTKSALNAIKRYEEACRRVDEIFSDKKTIPAEYQADWLKDKSEEYWLGWIHGIQAATEGVLHDENCWHGFQYVDTRFQYIGLYESVDGVWTKVREDVREHPEYENYRVSYGVK